MCAYSGWDDTFTDALIEVVRDDVAYPEIIWTFHDECPKVEARLAARLEPGIARGRVNLYCGVDCNEFFPRLYSAWLELEAPTPLPGRAKSNPVVVGTQFVRQVETEGKEARLVEGDDEDKPPLVEICVGRDEELRAIRESGAKVIFLTGLGGQGKSTVAAKYFVESYRAKEFSTYVWRDCKEERERFENQLASVVEKLSGGKIFGEDLAKQTTASIVEMLMTFILNRSVFFVFDNVDHYVNLEFGKISSGADVFVDALMTSQSPSRVIFTCRPSLAYETPLALTCHLQGLDLPAANSLFLARGAKSSAKEIEDAHALTDGHAFWLDLLALQVAKGASGTDLSKLVREIRSGGGLLPDKTLNSIWNTLNDRQRTVLRAMAETVRPEREADIEQYLAGEMRYHKLMKTLRRP